METMSKKTGIKFTPEQFRLLNQCVECGKASLIGKNSKCDSCIFDNFPHCMICGIVLRDGVHKFWAYDAQEEKRDEDVLMKVSKEIINEFTFEEESLYIKFSDTLCVECSELGKMMKNKCWICEKEFDNTVGNYKINGNQCRLCSARF